MMDDILESGVDFLFGGAVGLMSWFFGGRDGLIMVLITFMLVDLFSGLAAGWIEHKISSEAGFKGILKKCTILAFVGMAHLMDVYLLAHTVLGEAEAIRNVVALFYIANEGISIIENADRLGIPIPDFVRERFINMKKLNSKKERKKHEV